MADFIHLVNNQSRTEFTGGSFRYVKQNIWKSLNQMHGAKVNTVYTDKGNNIIYKSGLES